MFNLEIHIKSAVQLYQSTTVALNHPTTLHNGTFLLHCTGCTKSDTWNCSPTPREASTFNKIAAKLIKL